MTSITGDVSISGGYPDCGRRWNQSSVHPEAFDGLLLATVHVYTPLISPVTFRVWRYSAVIGFTNTVSFPSVTSVESLVQVAVVAGPPVEIEVSNYGM